MVKSNQLPLFATQEIRKKCRKIFDDLGDDDLRIGLASELMLDLIRGWVDRFPVENQQQIVALLADGYMEKWRKDGV